MGSALVLEHIDRKQMPNDWRPMLAAGKKYRVVIEEEKQQFANKSKGKWAIFAEKKGKKAR